jgi:hypothetical protein
VKHEEQPGEGAEVKSFSGNHSNEPSDSASRVKGKNYIPKNNSRVKICSYPKNSANAIKMSTNTKVFSI